MSWIAVLGYGFGLLAAFAFGWAVGRRRGAVDCQVYALEHGADKAMVRGMVDAALPSKRAH